jgi:hypothetical protein
MKRSAAGTFFLESHEAFAASSVFPPILSLPMRQPADDVPAFHEAFVDLSALFSHLLHKEALLATLQKTDGRLFDYRLEPSSRLNASAHPTIQAELRKSDPLVNLAMHFAQRRIFAESAASYSQMGSFGHGLEIWRSKWPYQEGKRYKGEALRDTRKATWKGNVFRA